MFTNIFGKGYLKFANFVFKNSVIQINKDANIININSSNKSPSEEPKIFPSGENIITNGIKKNNSIDLEKKFLPLKNLDHLKIKRKDDEAFTHGNLSNLTNFPSLIRNRLKNRVCEWHISANDPREDRSASIQLKNIDGYFISVLDGHGGDCIAKIAKKELHKKFDQKISSLKFSQNLNESEKEEMITQSIQDAFETLEREIYQISKEKFQKRESKFAFVGCCVLCIVVHDNLLITANLGDCKAVLYRRQRNTHVMGSITSDGGLENYSYVGIKLSTTHNARKHQEQYKLRNKFKDSDIIIDTNYASYVKGRLQPTRSLGDMYLKHKEFNDINFLESDYLKQSIPIKDFNGPYIDHLPDIKSHLLTEDDEFLVLGTDGLWELLNTKEVCDIINANNKNKLNITDSLRRAALSKAALKANINFEDMLKLPKSLKRAIHDDISIMVVDLKNQVVI